MFMVCKCFSRVGMYLDCNLHTPNSEHLNFNCQSLPCCSSLGPPLSLPSANRDFGVQMDKRSSRWSLIELGTGSREGLRVNFFLELLYCQLWILFQALIEFFFFLAALKCHFIISSFCSIFYLSLYHSMVIPSFVSVGTTRPESETPGTLASKNRWDIFRFCGFTEKETSNPLPGYPVTHPWTLESRLIYEVTF